MSLVASIETGVLVKVVAASIVAGVVIVTTFSLFLYGADSFVSARREGRTARAVPFAVLATVSGLAFAAAIVLGFIVMSSK
jgi:hypothetical protein